MTKVTREAYNWQGLKMSAILVHESCSEPNSFSNSIFVNCNFEVLTLGSNFVCYEPTCDLEFLLGRYFHS